MKKVLIIDDDHDLLDMVCLMVLSNGIDAVGVRSGQEALKAMEEGSFALILMDIYLGDYDGRALAREWKESPRYKDIPILLYSAGTINPASVVDSRADGFFQKPFDMPVLINRMREMMES